MKLKVGVIFGGKSVEHEVSIISAIQAINHIDKDKYDIVPIYMSKEGIWYTGNGLFKIENYKNLDNLIKQSKPVYLCNQNNEFCLINTNRIIKKVIDKIDIAFPIVHGKNVEDGSLIGYLEILGIPYVGSGILGSALGQDKILLKQVLKYNQIPVIDYIWFYDNEYLHEKSKILKKIKTLGYPVIVKPASLGSSIGINFVEDESQIEASIEEAIQYDKKILIEKGISNLVELNCSVIGDYEKQETSEIEEVLSSNNILTYEDKYIGGGKGQNKTKGMVNTDRIIPANIDKNTYNKIQELSKSVFVALNLSGICRIDYILDKDNNQIYVNEPNIIPGSLSFYLWEPKGKKYKELLNDLIEIGLNNYKKSMKKINSFNTSLLENYNKNDGAKYKKVV